MKHLLWSRSLLSQLLPGNQHSAVHLMFRVFPVKTARGCEGSSYLGGSHQWLENLLEMHKGNRCGSSWTKSDSNAHISKSMMGKTYEDKTMRGVLYVSVDNLQYSNVYIDNVRVQGWKHHKFPNHQMSRRVATASSSLSKCQVAFPVAFPEGV